MRRASTLPVQHTTRRSAAAGQDSYIAAAVTRQYRLDFIQVYRYDYHSKRKRAGRWPDHTQWWAILGLNQ